MVIHRKIKRTISDNKIAYYGSILLITLGCLMFTLFGQLTASLNDALATFEQQYTQEDVTFRTDYPLLDTQPLEQQFAVTIEQGAVQDISLDNDVTLRVFAESQKVNRYALLEGSALQPGTIVLDPAFAKANHIQIGDKLKVGARSLTVNGFMSLPQYIYPLKKESDLLNDANHFGTAVVDAATFATLGEGSRYYSVSYTGLADEKGLKLEQLKQAISEQVNILSWLKIEDNPRVSYVTTKLNNLQNMSSTLPVIILALTCALVGVVLHRLLKKETKQIGILVSLGYYKKEIYKHYLTYPILISVSGSIVGTIVGVILVTPMADFMLSYFNMPLLSNHYDWLTLSASILLPPVALIAVAYVLIRQKLTLTPITLLRGTNEVPQRLSFEKSLNLNKYKFVTKFIVREQLRSLPRNLFLLIGVVMASMLILLGFTMKSSIDQLLTTTYEKVYNYNYDYQFNTFQFEPLADGEPYSAAPFLQQPNDKRVIVVIGVTPNSKAIQLKNDNGKKLTFKDPIITKSLAERLNLQKHDTLRILNKLNGSYYRIYVDEIADSYAGDFVYLPLDLFNEMLGYPQNSYLGAWSKQPLQIDQNQIRSVTTKDEMKEAFTTMIVPLETAEIAIGILSFIIGLVVLFVVMSINIDENRNTISFMKVLGYRRYEITRLILSSSSYIVLLGYVISVPLLYFSLEQLFSSMSASTGLIMPVVMDVTAIILGLFFIYSIYFIVEGIHRPKLEQISLHEALQKFVE